MKELTKTQLTELTADLHTLADELASLLEATAAGAKPVKLKDNTGRLTRMDEMHTQSILIANRNVTSNRLKAVAIAAIRVENGTYGACTDCDEPIGFARLKAYPEASLCIKCKSNRE